VFTQGERSIEVHLHGQTLWLTQLQMAQLFGTTPENVLMHLKNIFAEGELAAPATTKDFLAVRQEGKRQVRRRLKHYNLDAIISVGYRVSSVRATQFRIWATGAFLFLCYLRLNQHLLAQPVEQLINDHTLVALTLLLAESAPDQKELMTGLVEHFLILK